ncbi:GNAT family N-acetyltransferase [Clostridium sp. 'White wine YQ']|uniref:GNAT family N-acetyltransferase n=1 Tax=Clostridium sp. 'White wine YQ' TaxID=3027474 RepID=UPI002366DDC0|nr:GNAT family N-acetyltransferase [Clostridium sp. 'White wine YQ']MDD7793847.1 GNAT family N-acetyltransferase [Clostridium sp. 'White wine YQ']
MKIKKVKKFDLNLIKKISDEAIEMNPLNEDFEEVYSKANILDKLVLRTNLKVYSYEDKLGIIWKENLRDDYVNLRSLYFQDGFEEFPLNEFKSNKFYSFETTATEDNTELLNKIGFQISDESIVLLKKLGKVNLIKAEDVEFKVVQSNVDIKTRVEIQNSIFKDVNRSDLKVADIVNDMKQSYYIDDLSILIMHKGLAIGYGQVIYLNKQYLVVNFGIIDGYRKKGYGRILLNRIIATCADKNIKDLYIRVSEKNTPAVNLYNSVGFNYYNKVVGWIR